MREKNDVMEGDKVMIGDPPSPLPHQKPWLFKGLSGSAWLQD